MPTILRARGFQIRIYPNDHHPPHVHVAKAGGVVVLNIARNGSVSIRTVWKIPVSDIRAAVRLVEQNADDLLQRWRELHD